MAKFNLIQRVLGSLAQTTRGTESVVKFGPAVDDGAPQVDATRELDASASAARLPGQRSPR